MNTDVVAIRPHTWRDRGGLHTAECYPFVNGRPADCLAGCEHCTKYRGPGENCVQWKDCPEKAPLFCGPICPEFDLVEDKRSLLRLFA